MFFILEKVAPGIHARDNSIGILPVLMENQI